MKYIYKFLLLVFCVFSFGKIYGQADPGCSGMSFTKSIFQINEAGVLEVIIGNYSGGVSSGTALSPYDATFTITIPNILKVNGALNFSKVPFKVTIVSQMPTFSGATVIVLTIPDGIPKGGFGTVVIPILAIKGNVSILYATVRTEFNLSYPPSGNILPANDLVSSPVSVVTPLPVKLSSFKAAKENSQINLDWTTTSEENSEQFDIEHSSNGKQWALLGTIASSGDSKIRQDYHFTHENPIDGNNYYRLKMIDKDQTFAFSTIRNVDFEDIKLEIYPNPVSDRLTINMSNWNSVNNIQLINMYGITVYDSGKIPSQSIDVANLKQGIYIMKIAKMDGASSIQKIMVQR